MFRWKANLLGEVEQHTSNQRSGVKCSKLKILKEMKETIFYYINWKLIRIRELQFDFRSPLRIDKRSKCGTIIINICKFFFLVKFTLHCSFIIYTWSWVSISTQNYSMILAFTASVTFAFNLTCFRSFWSIVAFWTEEDTV